MCFNALNANQLINLDLPDLFSFFFIYSILVDVQHLPQEQRVTSRLWLVTNAIPMFACRKAIAMSEYERDFPFSSFSFFIVDMFAFNLHVWIWVLYSYG